MRDFSNAHEGLEDLSVIQHASTGLRSVCKRVMDRVNAFGKCTGQNELDKKCVFESCRFHSNNLRSDDLRSSFTQKRKCMFL